MIDMENLQVLLDTPGRVVDAPGARDLMLHKAAVAFRDVAFAYERGASVLKGVRAWGARARACVHVCVRACVGA
jgi:ABC-type transport system involved in Fe-S cluster assembly fused permease/ATPase subunit